MKIELIPVIEIGYNNQGISAPKEYPYWENSKIWDDYHRKSYKEAGFKDEFVPYLAGSSFFEPKYITDDNLGKLVFDHTEELRKGAYEREQACGFFGGFVLRIDNEDKFYPQCCGTLSDIVYWERISRKKISSIEGHPEPVLKFRFNKITFDFSVGDYDEHFQPTPPDVNLEVDRKELEIAVAYVKSELQILSKRVTKIGEEMNLGIERIEDLLIWDNSFYD